MTYKQLLKAYLKLFILIVECAGEETGNQIYKDVEQYISKDVIPQLVAQDAPLTVLISILISQVLIQLHGTSRMQGYENSDDLNTLIIDFFERYLRKPTNKFLVDNGFDEIEEFGNDMIILKEKRI